MRCRPRSSTIYFSCQRLASQSQQPHSRAPGAQHVGESLTGPKLPSFRNITAGRVIVVAMAAEKVHMAMDLKEAASLKDPFAEHMAAPDKEEMVELEKEMNGAFDSPRPDHERIEKLLVMQSSLEKAAHVKCTPEDQMWRAELNDAVRQMDQTA